MEDDALMNEILANEALTLGHWQTEAEAEEFFVSFALRSGLFKPYRQVKGEPLCKHHFQQAKGVRADVLLFPTPRLVAAGWQDGCIVVEVKRSGEKIGPGLNQLLDYMNTAWFVPGGAVVPGFGFLFPAPKQHGPLASLMAHQHIGTVALYREHMRFLCGEARVLQFSADGQFALGRRDFGHKTGAR